LPLSRHGEGRGAMRRRLLVLLMAAFLVFAVSACGGGGGEDSLVVGEFAGEAPSADAFIALVAGKPKDGEREVRAYLCDGQKISEWFTGTASANELSLSSESGAKLEAKLTTEAATGTITLSDGGDSFDFEVPQATGIDGYYPLNVMGGSAIGTSRRGAELMVQVGGGDQSSNFFITPPGDEAKEVRFDVIVPSLKPAGRDYKPGVDEWHWIVLADEEQVQIKGSRKGKEPGFIDVTTNL
jgi:hypothetical protein